MKGFCPLQAWRVESWIPFEEDWSLQGTGGAPNTLPWRQLIPAGPSLLFLPITYSIFQHHQVSTTQGSSPVIYTESKTMPVLSFFSTKTQHVIYLYTLRQLEQGPASCLCPAPVNSLKFSLLEQHNVSPCGTQRLARPTADFSGHS